MNQPKLLVKKVFINRVILVVSLIFCVGCFTQVNTTYSTRSWGMANANFGQRDVWNVYQQAAYLAFEASPAVGVNYTNLFLLSEFSTTALAAVMPFWGRNAVGLGYSFQGYSLYQEHLLVGAYAFRVTPNWSVGFAPTYRYFRFAAAEFGNVQRFNLDLSSKVFLLEQLSLTLQMRDVYQTNFVDVHELPIIFEMGLAYTISKQVQWTLQASKGLTAPFSAQTGLEYLPVDRLFLRLGMSYEPILFALGVGTFWRESMYLDVAMAYHLVLGFVPSLSFRVDFPYTAAR